MKKADFEEAIKTLNVGDLLRLTVRGNYEKYWHQGELRKIENGRIYLTTGFAHHYRRIEKIVKVKE